MAWDKRQLKICGSSKRLYQFLFKSIWSGSCLLALSSLPVSAHGAVLPPWDDASYAYQAESTPLRTVLQDFAQTFGVILELDGEVEGVVSGRLQGEEASDVLTRLAVQFGFQWFIYNNTLYISPAYQEATARLEISHDAAPDIQQALRNIGLLDDRFGWGELPHEGIVLVSGPERYVELVREFSQRRITSSELREVISFPLRYAQAVDRTIDYRDDTLTIPGVATILSELLEASPSMGTSRGLSSSRNRAGTMIEGDVLGGASSALRQRLEEQVASQIGLSGVDEMQQTLGSGGGDVRVAADARNNAVLIYDDPDRHSLYRNLINQLDVPRHLVEVDAIIVDINRNKLEELAADWTIVDGGFSAGATMLPPGASSTIFIQDYGNFYSQLRALEGEGVASLVANPTILTLENQPAIMDLSSTEYIMATGERVSSILPVTAGTTLRTTPNIVRRGDQEQFAHGAPSEHVIQLDINIEDGNIDVSAINSELPRVNSASVSTEAVVGEMQSLVIGGFHSTESTGVEQRVPFLGRIPILGKLLFSSNQLEQRQRERLFIITPRLIGDQIDPSQYLSSADRYRVNSALERIDSRRASDLPISRGDIENSMSMLAVGRIPEGFDPVSAPSAASPSALCVAPTGGWGLDSANMQWYSGEYFDVAVLLVENISYRRQRFDEANCDMSNALAVALWPNAWMEHGDKAEIYIALRKEEPLPAGTRSRQSLLVSPQMPIASE